MSRPLTSPTLLSDLPGRLGRVPSPDPARPAYAAAGLPDAEVTVTDSGAVVVKLPGDVAFYVTSAAR